MKLDERFVYLPSCRLAVMQANGAPIAVSALETQLGALCEQDIGVLFDLASADADVLAHPQAAAIFDWCETRGIPVTLYVTARQLKARKSALDVLGHRGLITELRIGSLAPEIEKAGFFASLVKYRPALVRRMVLELNLLESDPCWLDDLAKPLLAHEKHDRHVVQDGTRAFALPRVLLTLGKNTDPFDARLARQIALWQSELASILRVARVSFDVQSYTCLEPTRHLNWFRIDGQRSRIFYVCDEVFCEPAVAA